MCKCGLGHRGWESNLCRIELAKRGDTLLSPSPIKPLLTDRSGSVSTKKAKSKPVSANTNKPSKPVSTNATRQAALKSRRTAAGVLILKIWAHVDDHAAIKKYAKDLASKR